MLARGEYTVSPLADGATGAAGRSVSSITEEYYLSTSKTAQADGSWVTTPPVWSAGKYLWTRSKIVYADPAGTEWTEPVCDSSWEAVNEVEAGLQASIAGAAESQNERAQQIADLVDDLTAALGELEGSSDANNAAVQAVIESINAAIKALNDEAEAIREGLGSEQDARLYSERYIKVGLLPASDENGDDRIGIAIGEELTTVTDVNGKVVFDKTKLACTITSNRITFWQDGKVVAYFSSGKLFVNEINTKVLKIGRSYEWEFATNPTGGGIRWGGV